MVGAQDAAALRLTAVKTGEITREQFGGHGRQGDWRDHDSRSDCDGEVQGAIATPLIGSSSERVNFLRFLGVRSRARFRRNMPARTIVNPSS